MLTCKQVSKALAAGDYRDLTPLRRLLLQLHVFLCFICRGENRDIMIFQDISRALRRKEETPDSDIKLPEDARKRIRDAMGR